MTSQFITEANWTLKTQPVERGEWQLLTGGGGPANQQISKVITSTGQKTQTQCQRHDSVCDDKKLTQGNKGAYQRRSCAHAWVSRFQFHWPQWICMGAVIWPRGKCKLRISIPRGGGDGPSVSSMDDDYDSTMTQISCSRSLVQRVRLKRSKRNVRLPCRPLSAFGWCLKTVLGQPNHWDFPLGIQPKVSASEFSPYQPTLQPWAPGMKGQGHHTKTPSMHTELNVWKCSETYLQCFLERFGLENCVFFWYTSYFCDSHQIATHSL